MPYLSWLLWVRIPERGKTMKEIDCRGMACIMPVIRAKLVLQEFKEEAVIFIVDNPASRDNVEKFLQSQGCSVKIEQKGQDFFLHLEKGCDDRAAKSAP
jgi:TusA-related sulfurtransferase